MTALLRHVASYIARDIDNAGLVSRHLLDTLGAWLAGRQTSEGQDILRPFSSSTSQLLGSLVDDVVREIAVTRLTEIDDIHRASCTTCGSVIIPVAVLLAEQTKPDAQTFMRAIAHGYETMMRLGLAVNGPALLTRGIWPSYLAAPFGTAVTASLLLNLDETRTAHALALALQQISGAPGGHPNGKSARWLLIGLAARAGITSALMAAQGYEGDLTLFDDDWMERTHGIPFDPASFESLTPILQETSIKPWCSAKQTTSAIEAFQSMLADGLKLDEIAKIKIAVPHAYHKMIASHPPGRLGRIVNVGWQLGLSAYAPDYRLALDRACGSFEQEITLLAQKVEVIADAELDPLYPKCWPARITVQMKDGAQHTRFTQSALGDPESPMSQKELEQKFAILTQGKAQAIADLLDQPLNDQRLSKVLQEMRQHFG